MFFALIYNFYKAFKQSTFQVIATTFYTHERYTMKDCPHQVSPQQKFNTISITQVKASN